MNATALAPVPSPATTPTVDVVMDVGQRQVVAVVRGAVNFHSVNPVRAKLLRLAAGGTRDLVVDLTEADLQDPTGAAALVHVQHVCRQHGTDVRVAVRAASRTQRLLTDCGLLASLDPVERTSHV